MIFGNRTVEDILLRQELDSFKINHTDRFKLHFTVDVDPKDPSWTGGVGFVT